MVHHHRCGQRAYPVGQPRQFGARHGAIADASPMARCGRPAGPARAGGSASGSASPGRPSGAPRKRRARHDGVVQRGRCRIGRAGVRQRRRAPGCRPAPARRMPSSVKRLSWYWVGWTKTCARQAQAGQHADVGLDAGVGGWGVAARFPIGIAWRPAEDMRVAVRTAPAGTAAAARRRVAGARGRAGRAMLYFRAASRVASSCAAWRAPGAAPAGPGARSAT